MQSWAVTSLYSLVGAFSSVVQFIFGIRQDSGIYILSNLSAPPHLRSIILIVVDESG